MKLQRIGGYAAIAFALGFVAALLLKGQLAGDRSDPSKFRDLVSTAPVGFYSDGILTVIIFSLLLIMFIALYERMQNKAPQLTLISLIASSVGTAIMVSYGIFSFDGIRIALQHGVPEKIIEARWTFLANGDVLIMAFSHFYGWAFLLMGLAILRVRPFSTILGWLFVVTGVLNITSFMLNDLNVPGHLISFVAAVWTGIAMLRQKLPQTALEEMTVSR